MERRGGGVGETRANNRDSGGGSRVAWEQLRLGWDGVGCRGGRRLLRHWSPPTLVGGSLRGIGSVVVHGG